MDDQKSIEERLYMLQDELIDFCEMNKVRDDDMDKYTMSDTKQLNDSKLRRLLEKTVTDLADIRNKYEDELSK